MAKWKWCVNGVWRNPGSDVDLLLLRVLFAGSVSFFFVRTILSAVSVWQHKMKTAQQSRKITKEHSKANESNASRKKKSQPNNWQSYITEFIRVVCRVFSFALNENNQNTLHYSGHKSSVKKKTIFVSRIAKLINLNFVHRTLSLMFTFFFSRRCLLCLFAYYYYYCCEQHYHSRAFNAHVNKSKCRALWRSLCVRMRRLLNIRTRCQSFGMKWSVVDTLVLHEIKSHNILVVRTRCIFDLVHGTDCAGTYIFSLLLLLFSLFLGWPRWRNTVNVM